MRSLPTLSLLLAFLATLAHALDQADRTIDIFAWPLSSPAAQTLARVTYSSTGAVVQSYTPLTVTQSDEIVRVGFHHPSGAWSGIATSGANFAAEKDKTLQLLVNGEGVVYHVGFRASDYGTSGVGGKGRDGLSAEVVKVQPGPTPLLNKPVVVNADGSPPDKEAEKSFLQKYWWAIAGFLLLQVVMSVGKGE